MMDKQDGSGDTAALHGDPRYEVDVVIVGAGPTGLMAAALLGRSGVRVRVLEKSATTAKESRAFAIHARTLELLGSIGLADAFLNRGLLASGAEFFVDGRHAAEFPFDDLGRNDTPYPFVLLLPQSDTEAILVEEVRRLGIEVERGVEVTGFVQDEAGVDVEARGAGGDRLAIRAAYVIGADGAHSVVRKGLGLTFEGAAYPQTFLLADCKVEWPLDQARLKVFLHGDDFALYLPLKGAEYGRVIVTDPAPPGPAEIGSAGAAALPLPQVEAALRRASKLDVALSEPRWTSRYRVHHRAVDRYGIGRVFVAGDAAHIHSPAGGQGMNTGLQDAANLAWKLAAILAGSVSPDLLLSYDAERRPVGLAVLRNTDRAFTMMTTQSGWVAAVRDTIVPILASTMSHVRAARARGFHTVSQLGIRYEPGPFVADGSSADASRDWRKSVPAGHRAPDAAIARGRSVFDLIGGYRWSLLALSRRPLRAEEVASLSDAVERLKASVRSDLATTIVARSLIGRDPRLLQAELGEAFDAYGVSGDTAQGLYLIRPDGYVAWRTDSLDVEAAGRFLADRLTAA